MRCTVCNKALSDYESTMKHAMTGQYMDICQACVSAMGVEIPVYDRKDLLHEADLVDYADVDYLDEYSGDSDYDDIYKDR